MNVLALRLKTKNKHMKFASILLFFLLSLSLLSQSDTGTKAVIVNDSEMNRMSNNDTLLYKSLRPVYITEKGARRTPQEEEEYQKLKRRVIKLYPYALMAKEIYETTNQNINSLESNKEKRQFRKKKEQELRDRFENEIKALYTTDGPVLVKLIHRETGKTTYELLRESKSWINCMFYQMAAKRYGYSLKETFSPKIDKDIENMVQILKSEGQLPVYTSN